jgi:glycosyltransferase involved in cell wall biosynthesis
MVGGIELGEGLDQPPQVSGASGRVRAEDVTRVESDAGHVTPRLRFAGVPRKMIADDRRLTMLHVDLGRQWRGGQNQALLLAAELRRMGHGVELMAIAGGPLAERARKLGIPVHEVAGRFDAALRLRGLASSSGTGDDNPHRGFRGHSYWTQAEPIRTPECGVPEISPFATSRFDVVHCHEPHALTAAWCAGVHRRTVCVTARRVAYPIVRNPIARLRYRSAKRIIAVSQFVKESVLARGFLDEQVEVIHDGVVVPDAPAVGGGGLVLGCVGWLLPEKNQELLIRSLPAVLARYPGCRLVLAGDGPNRHGLEQLAARLEVAAAVRFAGLVDDVSAVYRALDVFVFPSLAEPLGSSLLSAMAYGLPCVALARGAVPEVIDNGKTGLLVEAPDPPAFADAILRLLDNASLRARLGTAARQTVEDRFSVACMAEETVALYHRAGK